MIAKNCMEFTRWYQESENLFQHSIKIEICRAWTEKFRTAGF